MRKRPPISPDVLLEETEEQPGSDADDIVLSVATPKVNKEAEKILRWLESQIQIAYRTVGKNSLAIYITVPAFMGNTITIPKEETEDEIVVWEHKKFVDSDRTIYKCPEIVSSIESSRNLVGPFIVLYQTKYIMMARRTPANNLIH